MGHRDKVKKLGRTKSHREAMLANMAMSLFTHRVIRTTDTKAKALKPLIDRIISTAKKDTLHAKRLVAKTIKNKEVHKKLFTEIIPQFTDRTSGFSRVIKLGVRRGDGAPISVVELLTEKPVEDTKKSKKDAKASAGDKNKGARKTAPKPSKDSLSSRKTSAAVQKTISHSTKNK
jgi:large subunit ribosomal protein L17